MNKLTKIVATIGPSSDSEEMIEKLILQGVNVFRFNFKHNTMDWHSERIQRVNGVAHRIGISVGSLIDLQGPEIRINMPTDKMDLEKGDLLVFGQEALDNKEKGFSISHPEIIEHLEEGQKILADDGAFSFFFERKDNKTYLRVDNGGTLGNRKSMNIPGAQFPFPVLVDRDFEALKVAALNEVDYVALSFVRSAEDLKVTRSEMQKYKVNAKLVAKIETQKAIDDLDNIIENADALMVARGDLGVEMPMEQVPFYQKLMIKKCMEKGIPVITATQMLQSMITAPYPTRAEVSDIANAAYDLTDAVMLSGETANGKYPLEAVTAMNKTIEFNERQLITDTRRRFSYVTKSQTEIICDAAYNMYLKYASKEDIQAFVVFTQTGTTTHMLSRYRPQIPVFAITPNVDLAESLTVNFGVYAFPANQLEVHNTEVNVKEISKTLDFLVQHNYLSKGKSVIVLHGEVWGIAGGTSTIKILPVK